MKMKKIAAVFAAAAILVSGCSRGPAASAGFSPDQSSVYVTRTGAVTGAAVEKLENDYYDATELKASTEEDLAAFNGTKEQEESSSQAESQTASAVADAAGAVLKECTIKDGVARILIDFKNPEEYTRYAQEFGDADGPNQITWLDVAGVNDALTKGYLMDAQLVKPSGDTKTVSVTDVAKQNLYMVAVKGAGVVQTEGKIQYISDNVTVTGDTTAQTPEDGTAYIVFK